MPPSDDEPSTRELGITYRPSLDTLTDTVTGLRAVGRDRGRTEVVRNAAALILGVGLVAVLQHDRAHGRERARGELHDFAAVRGGLISLEDALTKYRLTAEEFIAWQQAIDKWGMQGLRTTRIQSYRD